MTKLTFDRIETHAVLLPLKRKIVAKVGTFESWPVITIDLHTKEGVTGRAYLEPYHAPSVPAILTLINHLANVRKGKPIHPADDFRAGLKGFSVVGLTGLTMIALSGVDMAAWDACARAADMPMCEYLGGSIGPVKAYNSNGLWLYPVETIADDARSLVEEGGFTAMKLRLGREKLADDLAAIDAVRQGAGDDVTIMVDFNQGLSMDQALDLLRALDDQGLYWFEEPISYDLYDGYAELARVMRTPIQLGENFYGPRDLERAVKAKAGQYMMPDFMRIGGITGWMQSAAIAGAAGIPISNHLYGPISTHMMRVVDTPHWLEYTDWASGVLAEQMDVKDGIATPPNTPGLGLEWNHDNLEKYRLDL